MNECIFCDIAQNPNRSSEVFYEDEKVFAVLDLDWAVKGHSLVVWKDHVLNASDLSKEEFAHFSEVCRKVEAKLLDVLDVEKSIILKSGGLEPHFHFHIYPISSNTPWETVKDIFDKKTKYIPEEGEKELLLERLNSL